MVFLLIIKPIDYSCMHYCAVLFKVVVPRVFCELRVYIRGTEVYIMASISDIFVD